MPSRKHHTSSPSGKSPKSTKRPSSSRRFIESSATAQVSFVPDPVKPNPELLRAKTALQATQWSLEDQKALPAPLTALGRAKHKQRLARLTKYVKDLHEHIAFLEEGNN